MARNFGAIPANEAGWPDTPPGGGGTVTSVGLSAPTELSVSGSPVTGSGTLALSWASQSANSVLAGPTSGSAATPTFRALTGADLSAAWPVGSIYLGVLSANPATLLGFGTWSSIGAGRVLVGVDPADTDFDTSQITGGAKTVASAGSVAAPVFTGSAMSGHVHGPGTLAVADHPAHTHSVTSNVSVDTHSDHTHLHTPTGTIAWPAGVPTFTGTGGTTSGDGATVSNTSVGGSAVRNVGGHTHSFTPAGTNAWPAGVPTLSGSSTATGNPSAALTHSVTNTAVTSGNPSATLTHSFSGETGSASGGTPAGTNSAPAFTGSATSVVQPYYVCYMWLRTA